MEKPAVKPAPVPYQVKEYESQSPSHPPKGHSGVPIKDHVGQKPLVISSVPVYHEEVKPIPAKFPEHEMEKPAVKPAPVPYQVKEYESQSPSHPPKGHSGVPIKDHVGQKPLVISSVPVYHEEVKPIPAKFPEHEMEKPAVKPAPVPYQVKEYESQSPSHPTKGHSGVPIKDHVGQKPLVISSVPVYHEEVKPIPAKFPEHEMEKPAVKPAPVPYQVKEYESQSHSHPPMGHSGVPIKDHVGQKPLVISSVTVYHEEVKPIPAKFPEHEMEKPAVKPAPVPYQVKEYESQSPSHPPKGHSGVPIKDHVEHKPMVVSSVPVYHEEVKPIPAKFSEHEMEKPAVKPAPVPYQVKEYESQSPSHPPKGHSGVPIKDHVGQKPLVISSVPVYHEEVKPIPAKFPEHEMEKPAVKPAPVPYQVKEYESQSPSHPPKGHSGVPIKDHVGQKPLVISSVPVYHEEVKPIPAKFPEHEMEKPAVKPAPVPYQVKEYESQSPSHPPKGHSGVPIKDHVGQKPLVISSVPVYHEEVKPIPAKFPEHEMEKPAVKPAPVPYQVKEYESQSPSHPTKGHSGVPIKDHVEHKPMVVSSVPVYHEEVKPIPAKFSEHEMLKPSAMLPPVHSWHDKPTSYVKPENIPILPHSEDGYSHLEYKPAIKNDDIDYRVYKKYPGFIPEESEFDKKKRIKETVQEYIKKNYNVFEDPEYEEEVEMVEGRPRY
ncbi:titin-like [Phlebotomus argentipes]|uniref:titin-like n=1 Tax=Phlebotomus argentipes TaxID=94469 RepID=UPI0028935181|nr:titin-like [Phlebotomus argentipes]